MRLSPHLRTLETQVVNLGCGLRQKETGALCSVPESANAAAGFLLRERLARVSLRTGSAGGGIFSLPNREMAVAYIWRDNNGWRRHSGPTLDDLVADVVPRVACRARWASRWSGVTSGCLLALAGMRSLCGPYPILGSSYG